MPQRRQLRRTAGYRLAPNARAVTRPGYYGNPYKVGDYYLVGELLPFPVPTARLTEGPAGERNLRCVRCPDAQTAVDWFRQWAAFGLEPSKVYLLRGLDLACWCCQTDPCHADVLLELANGSRP